MIGAASIRGRGAESPSPAEALVSGGGPQPASQQPVFSSSCSKVIFIHQQSDLLINEKTIVIFLSHPELHVLTPEHVEN